ncbi:MAG: hypothetical protein AAGA08_01005 [Pseudomonadota bacterium]
MNRPPSHSEHHHMDLQGNGGARNRFDTYPFGKFESDTLSIARMFFVSFHLPQRNAWVSAFEFGEDTFGRQSGALITKTVLDTVNELRIARTSGFEYCDPFCPTCREFLTREERYLVSIIHQMRERNMASAKMNAMLLCEGGDTQKMMNHIADLISFAPETVH